MINNAAQAKEALSFAKFPPRGVRGQGGPFACYEFGFATPAEYVAAANDLVVVMVQIETVDGLKNVDEICQIDGVGKCCNLYLLVTAER
jgi:4-hydroxy-2-oxoheptanedioate aldolase